MKKYILALVLALFSVSVHAQEKTPDSVITKAFRYLKIGDEAGYLGLFPNRQQYEKILTSLISSPKDDSIIKESLRNISDEEFKNSILPYNLDKFRLARKMGQDKGIDWSKVFMNRYEMDSTFIKYTANHRNGIIYFSDSKEYFKLRFEQIELAPGEGWLGINFTELSGKDWDKEIEPFPGLPGDSVLIEEHLEVRDVIMTTVSEKEAPPPPPPPPANPKKKSVVKEVPKKTKTKS